MNFSRWPLAVLAVAAWATSLQAHGVQTVAIANLTLGGTPATSPVFVAAGDVVKFDAVLTANGAVNPPGTNGLGLCLEYAQAIAGDPAILRLESTGLIANGRPQAILGCNDGGAVNVPGADFTIVKGWGNVDQAGWPNMALPLKLYDAQFTLVASPAVVSRIGFAASAVAIGEAFVPGPPLALCARPTVTVSSSANGSETGAAPAKFSVTLSAAVPAVCASAGSFPVSLTLGGTATPPGQSNADYSISGANVVNAGSTITVNFPGDGATTTISVNATPVDDSLAEGTETVMLSVAAGSGNYLIGNPGTASANILDNDISPVSLSPASVPGGTVGVSYATQTFAGSAGTAPYVYAVSGGVLPGGLAFTAGTVSGTPTAAGTFNFAVSATDSTGAGAGGPFSASQVYQIVVAKGSQSISFGTLTDRALYSAPFTVSATSSSGLTVSFGVTGPCTIAASSVTVTGVGTCTVRASQAGSANWNAGTITDRPFTVLPPSITLNPATLTAGALGVGYTAQTLSASGGAGAYSYSVTTGAIPSGMTLTSAGVLSGTPTAIGNFGFNVTATDSSAIATGGPFTGSRAYSLSVAKGAGAVIVISNFNPSVQGQTVVLSAAVAGSAPAPTGTVTFFDGSTPICSTLPITVVPGSSAQASCLYNPATAGSRSLTASYSGDGTYAPATSPVYLLTVQVSSTLALQVARGGTGSGTVTSNPPGINCGVACTQPYAGATSVALSATPNAGSLFIGWLGACAGNGSCNAIVNGPTSVGATFAPDTVQLSVDIDSNGKYDALTDGLLMIRYMFGLTGTALTGGAIGGGATRTDPTQLLIQMNNIRPLLDVDGDGQVDALTDGLLFIRYMFGVRGASLTAGALGAGATRTTAAQIETYIQSVMP